MTDVGKGPEIVAPVPVKTDSKRVVVVGTPGKAFNIDGPGLGDETGSLTIGGKSIEISSWTDRVVKGVLPPETRGAVVLTLANGDVRNGLFPPAPKA